MNQIIIPENSSSNCSDCVIYSLLKYYSLDYEAYNIKYFYTDYYILFPKNPIYFIQRGKVCGKVLKDIYNIELTYTNRNISTDLFEIVTKSLKRRKLVGVDIDPYFCHWSPFYTKTHYSHTVLIIDIDYQKKEYICFDVYFNTVGYVKVNFDIINNNYERYFIFDFIDQNEIELESMINTINLSLERFNHRSNFQTSEIINIIKNNRREMLFSENIETSIPLINLMWIAEDKRHFPIALKYIEKRINKSVFSSIYELLSNSERSILFLKTILMKYALSNVLNEDKIKGTIDQIFDMDALIVNQMRNVLNIL